MDCWFQALIGILRGEPSKDDELTQVPNLPRTMGISGIGSPDWDMWIT